MPWLLVRTLAMQPVGRATGAACRVVCHEIWRRQARVLRRVVACGLAPARLCAAVAPYTPRLAAVARSDASWSSARQRRGCCYHTRLGRLGHWRVHILLVRRCRDALDERHSANRQRVARLAARYRHRGRVSPQQCCHRATGSVKRLPSQRRTIFKRGWRCGGPNAKKLQQRSQTTHTQCVVRSQCDQCRHT